MEKECIKEELKAHPENIDNADDGVNIEDIAKYDDIAKVDDVKTGDVKVVDDDVKADVDSIVRGN